MQHCFQNMNLKGMDALRPEVSAEPEHMISRLSLVFLGPSAPMIFIAMFMRQITFLPLLPEKSLPFCQPNQHPLSNEMTQLIPCVTVSY